MRFKVQMPLWTVEEGAVKLQTWIRKHCFHWIPNPLILSSLPRFSEIVSVSSLLHPTLKKKKRLHSEIQLSSGISIPVLSTVPWCRRRRLRTSLESESRKSEHRKTAFTKHTFAGLRSPCPSQIFRLHDALPDYQNILQPLLLLLFYITLRTKHWKAKSSKLS